jgi:prepilin-type N-terminal cleavage/methylation domain-containing protein
MKKAFTLIELLVVIAIIAILAAILFPVFAQAKAAAKATVAISNQKQIILAEMMYMNDYDSQIPLDQYNIPETTGLQQEIEWKGLILPYVKNLDIFKDPVNPAARYYDADSDPTLRAYWNYAAAPTDQLFARGYTKTDLFYLTGTWSENPFTPDSYSEPANLLSVVEFKYAWVSACPCEDWEYNWTEPDGGTLSLGWSWGGGKWSDAAQAVSFYDGHAKRVSNSAMCGSATSTTPNMWGYARGLANNSGQYIAGAQIGWIDTFCQTIPTGLQ